MGVKLSLEHGVYEVLDSNLHRYASTSISGGGTNSAGGINDIHTTVTHHSDQELWVKDVDTGKERKFEFSSFNVDARPGHKLLVIWDRIGKRMERVVNKDTELKNAAAGVYATWGSKNQFLRSALGRFVLNPLFVAVVSLIPFLGWLVMGLMHLVGVLSGRLISGEQLKSGMTRAYNAIMLLFISGHVLLSAIYWDMISTHYGTLMYWVVEGFHFLLRPIYILIHQLGIPLGPWFQISLGIAVYMWLATVLINVHHHKRVVDASRRIDQYAKEVEKSHPAFQ